jgi:hypothetical protein
MNNTKIRESLQMTEEQLRIREESKLPLNEIELFLSGKKSTLSDNSLISQIIKSINSLKS